MLALPIDALLPEVIRSLVSSPSLVLEAPPGAGKTTRVPTAVLGALDAAGLAGEVVVLEPRRIAARMAARRVAEELGEPVGRTVGYAVRFEEVSSAQTRIRFVTEGVLTRRLIADPQLSGVGAVVLDEFHERHLHGDLALALTRRLQLTSRPELRLVVMSATLDAAPVAAFLGDAPRLTSEGRLYEVSVEHDERRDDRPLPLRVAGAVRRLVREGLDGDVLVFLPGAREIQQTGEALGAIAAEHDLALLPLHGSLSPAEQDRAVGPSPRRKIILSTNVAETSVTIDGVVAVVDSGWVRSASHSAWSGLPRLALGPISRASATQRAGRAGRTRPGRCLRLYTRGELMARPEHDLPEIARADLAETALLLASLEGGDAGAVPWLESPPAAAMEAASGLLRGLGAIDGAGGLAPTGRRLLALPIHPRLGRVALEGHARGVGADACAIAALLAERDGRSPDAGVGRIRGARGRSDVLTLLDELDERRQPSVGRVRERLARVVAKLGGPPGPRPGSPKAYEDALLISLLAGYPDRVGRLRRPENATGRAGMEVVLAGGGTASLSEQSVIGEGDLIVAIDVEERLQGRSAKAVVRLASEVEPDWLLDLFTERVTDTTEAVWNGAAQRVEVLSRLSYGALVLEESRRRDVDPALATPVLAREALAVGYRAFTKGDSLTSLGARLEFARERCPELGFPELGEPALQAALEALCEGRRSFAELADADLASAVRTRVGHDLLRRLDEVAPERVALKGGRRLEVVYASGAAPHVASRLQDFFGMADGPTIALGRVPVVLHLLAPNHRAVQITTDLAGFWVKHYPAIAKELRRRYPRHSWPDDPRAAQPPAPLPRRR